MAELFRAYLPSFGKIPMYSVKTGNLLPVPPTDTDYLGVLKPEYIQVDVDDSMFAYKIFDIVRAEKLKCDVLKTSRGLHFYFKNTKVERQGVHIFSACCIPCDYGLGSKDRVVPLKITTMTTSNTCTNGIEQTVQSKETILREWLQTYDEVDELPEWLLPISKYDLDILGTSTRNQTLYNYILKLQTKGLTQDGIVKTINIINRYLLPEPLSQREVDTITRPEAFSEEMFFDSDGKFMHDLFGNYMLSNCNILIINGNCNIYTSSGLYTNDPKEFERVMLRKIPRLKDAQRKEVHKYIVLQCSKKGEFADPKYIGLKNAVLDLETMTTSPYIPKMIINNKIDFDYNQDAYCEAMDKTIDKVCCNDGQIRSLLEEMIGYTLYRSACMQMCFVLTGEGSNGKSTILNCIKKLIGRDNYTSLDLRELEDTFKPAELYNKLANLGDDISAKYLDNSSKFKKCVTGESFLVQRKYLDPFELECYATQIFCANEIPSVSDKTDGFGRRITIVPFMAKFSKSDPDYDPFIESKLMSDSALEYLLKLGIEGLKRLLFNQCFTKSDASETEKREYIKMNNNVLDWFDSEPKIENEAVHDAYLAYTVWAAMNGCQAIKKINFGREIKKLGYITTVKTISGKSIRIYVKEGE